MKDKNPAHQFKLSNTIQDNTEAPRNHWEMAIPTLDKCCCCELRWGALIVGIMQFLQFGYILGRAFILETENDLQQLVLHIALTIQAVFLVTSVLIIVSVWVPKKQLPCIYIILTPIEIIAEGILLIYICTILDLDGVGKIVEKAFVWLACFFLEVYFWFVIYSWYKQLSSPAQS